ncbi:MAG: DUF488 domain-containing protein [Rickettsiales bacterium]|nr:DUF488 domain-containing protein [Rickettsiales bacterium]
MATLYTIGFAGKTEEEFYKILRDAGVRCIWDIRLWRDSVSEYFAWAKGSYLAARCGHKYKWAKELAPTVELLSGVKEKRMALADAFAEIEKLLSERRIETLFLQTNLDGACLMCSEKSADNCHRKIVAEYLARRFPRLKIRHL